MRHELWPVVSGLLVFVGLLASNGLLLVVGSLVAVVWMSARLWERYCFRKVTYDRELGRRRAFIGDTIDYTVALNNAKLLPLIWVEAQDPFPEGLELSGATLRGATLETNRHHSITTALLPYQRASWKFTMRCLRRGYHRIGPVRMRSSDIFGFVAMETRLANVDEILVYPRVIDLEQLLSPPQHPFGSSRGRLPLYHDTSRVKGQRDYHPDDPLKYIDWKATARARELQTRVFEPAVSLTMVVALNGSTSDHVWQGTNRRLFERAITAAASAAALADQRGYSYGLISNAVASYSGKWLSVPVGASPAQLTLTLEALAMAAPYVVAMLPDVFRAERDRLPAGATVLFVTGSITDSLSGQLAAIADRGYRLTVLYAGDGPAPERVGEIPVTDMGHLLDVLPEAEEDYANEPEFGGEAMNEAFPDS
jgi:uncharacterized repeat protein (TIGR01451 family)